MELKMAVIRKDETKTDYDEVLQWITNFYDTVKKNYTDVIHNHLDIAVNEIVRRTFRNGYCYFFAHMLKNAFDGRGGVFMTVPFGHFVWKDIDGTCYDVEGIYDPKVCDAFYLIPEEYVRSKLPNYFNSFRHAEIPGTKLDVPNKEEIINMIKEYCAYCNEEYDSYIEEYFYF